MNVPSRPWRLPGLPLMLYLLIGIFPLAASAEEPPAPAASPAASQTALPTKELSVVTVDLPVLFTFHPAMRNFDHFSGKFVSQVPFTPPTGGLKTWNSLAEERKKLAELETTLEAQLGKVNGEMAANNRPPEPDAANPRTPTWTEYQKYAEMSQEHRQLLSDLANQVLGGFPESLLGGLPEADLQRIANDVFEAVEAEAKSQNAALVLNLPSYTLGGTESTGTSAPPAPLPADPLERWQIKSLGDLEALVHQASGTSPLPFGKPLPAKDPKKFCGGHFESVTDPKHLRTLVEEYLAHQQIFCQPFENLGARRRILKGSLAFHEKDVTSEALARIFDRYKTRKLEREVILDLLRRQRGEH